MSLNLISPMSEIGVGQKFYIDLMIDTEGLDINAVQGAVNFPGNVLKFDSLSDGGSIITFWAEKPAYQNNSISFSGIIPGGFKGVLNSYYQGVIPGKILRLYFTSEANGGAFVKLAGAKAFLNDGKGTEINLKTSNLQFLVSDKIPVLPIPKTKTRDAESPEDFQPKIISDPNLFNGKYILIWATKDKESGIDHYEVVEQRGNITRNYFELPWQTAESPYILKDQELKSYVYVKAIDRVGNMRIVYLPPYYIPWYGKLPVDIIIGLGAIIVILLIIWRLWRKFRKRRVISGI